MAGGDCPQGNGMDNRILKESVFILSQIQKATVSNRLSTSPCVLVASQYTCRWSGNMERIMCVCVFESEVIVHTHALIS